MTATDIDSNDTSIRDRTIIIPVVLLVILLILMLLLRVDPRAGAADRSA